MTTAATYRRTARDDDGRAMLRQADRLTAFASRRGARIVADYADHNVSGNRDDRPALAALLADARAGRFDEVLVTDVDRLGRAHPVVACILATLDAAGVPVVVDSLDGPLGDALPLARMVLGATGGAR